MDRYVCIHGHFYQPPRENPWLEAVELQDSAHPFHDWNERITAECYGPNGASRILDGEGRIADIVNNYSRISFNFGPSLLSWLEEHAPAAYASVLAADRESRARFGGHGSAMAQAFNHMILPLASRRDKETQVAWGIRDFTSRFGRDPEGMWLPEAAVDVETLEVLAERGIRFTVLSPRQARRVRMAGDHDWRSVEGGRIDPSTAYEQRLPSGRRIALFFYDGPVSQAIAFEGLLSSGVRLADRLMTAFSDARPWAQLAHVATDGESYGHHHRHGDMALAYALKTIQERGGPRLTNYGEFLERHPPAHEVEIVERTSWSCAHGVERWRSDCGCRAGDRAGWTQAWRGPLRAAFDWLRDALAPRFEESLRSLLRDPWAARDDYISVMLDRSPESVERFLGRHAVRALSPQERIRARKLLEMQRHGLLMYTSCGWFFDEVSGLEAVQCLRYAGRAIQLAREVLAVDLEPRFLELLESARSNHLEHGDARRIFERLVRPAMVDLERVGAHYALSCLFEDYEPRDRIYCYQVERENLLVRQEGTARLALGRVDVTSDVTGESARMSFGVLHFGDHNLHGGVREFRSEESYESLVREMQASFAFMDVAALVRAVDRNFGLGAYTLRLLFREEQRKITTKIVEKRRERTEAVLRGLYDEHAPLMRFLTDVGVPLPGELLAIAEFVVESGIRRTLAATELDVDALRAQLDEARRAGIVPDATDLAFALRRHANGLATRLEANPDDIAVIARLEALADLDGELPFDIDLWHAENVYFRVLQDRRRSASLGGEVVDAGGAAWRDRFRSLGEKLRVRAS